MQTINEVMSSIRTYLSDRLRNPLYGAFLVSWLVLNFRLVLVLVGDGTWATKINYIDTRLYVAWEQWAIFGYLLPLSAALFYVLTAPYISRWISIFLRVTEKTTKTKLLAVEGEIPLTREEADQLRQKLFEAIESRRLERKKAQNENHELQVQINLLVEENAKLKNAATTVNDSSEKVELTLPAQYWKTKEGASNDVRLYPMQEDFVGVPSDAVLRLVSRGLSVIQASMLYVLRDGAKIDRASLLEKFSDFDTLTLKVALDQLLSLELVDSMIESPVRVQRDPVLTTISKTQFVSISYFGSQALEGLITRGFDPKKRFPNLT